MSDQVATLWVKFISVEWYLGNNPPAPLTLTLTLTLVSVPKLAEWGMGSAWSDEDLPSSVTQSHNHSQREHKQDSLRVGSSN